MLDAPKGLRLHIGLFGRRNVGKSSLLNALAAQSVSIVSDTPGTTTDPVEKTLESPRWGQSFFWIRRDWTMRANSGHSARNARLPYCLERTWLWW